MAFETIRQVVKSFLAVILLITKKKISNSHRALDDAETEKKLTKKVVDWLSLAREWVTLKSLNGAASRLSKCLSSLHLKKEIVFQKR